MKDVHTTARAAFEASEEPHHEVAASGTRMATRTETSLSFEALAEENIDFVFRCLRRCGLDEATADDAVQQVFLVASTKMDAIIHGKEKPFLYGVAKNVAAESRRKSARRQEVELVTQDDEGADLAGDGPSLDELLDQQRARVVLDEVLAMLSDRLRDVFVLSEIEELSAPEVAACLDIPLGTVASRLAKAREEFDRALVRVKARTNFRGER